MSKSKHETDKEGLEYQNRLSYSPRRTMLLLDTFGIWKETGRASKLNKNDQRNLLGLSVSSPKFTVCQVMDESGITIEVSVYAVRRIPCKRNLNGYNTAKSYQ